MANALGIGAASFWRRKIETEADVGVGGGIWKRDSVGASKDIAESPTAEPERPKKDYKTTRPQDYKLLG